MGPLVHIIDDNADVRDSLACLLESEDFEVRTYGAAEDFLAGAWPAAGCVVTDVEMHGISGLELLRRLRALGTQLPVIIMTGRGDDSRAAEAARYVAVFIEKPFDPDAMVAAVRQAFR